MLIFMDLFLQITCVFYYYYIAILKKNKAKYYNNLILTKYKNAQDIEWVQDMYRLLTAFLI